MIVIFTLALALSGGACGQSPDSDSANPSSTGETEPQTGQTEPQGPGTEDPLRAAYERIPFDGVGIPAQSEFPEEILLAHLECTRRVTGGASPPLAQTTREEDILYSDCAIESGVSDYAEIWVPLTESEEAEMIRRLDAELAECLIEAGLDEDLPTLQAYEGPYIDTDTLIAQDPNTRAIVEGCLGHSEGEID